MIRGKGVRGRGLVQSCPTDDDDDEDDEEKVLFVYLCEPQEVLHERAAVRVVDLHDGDLLLGRHQ